MPPVPANLVLWYGYGDRKQTGRLPTRQGTCWEEALQGVPVKPPSFPPLAKRSQPWPPALRQLEWKEQCWNCEHFHVVLFDIMATVSKWVYGFSPSRRTLTELCKLVPDCGEGLYDSAHSSILAKYLHRYHSAVHSWRLSFDRTYSSADWKSFIAESLLKPCWKGQALCLYLLAFH